MQRTRFARSLSSKGRKGTFPAAALSLSSQKHPLPIQQFYTPGAGHSGAARKRVLPAAPEPELPVGKAQPEGMCCSKTVKTAPALRSRFLRSYVPLRGFPNESVSESNTSLPADLLPGSPALVTVPVLHRCDIIHLLKDAVKVFYILISHRFRDALHRGAAAL